MNDRTKYNVTINGVDGVACHADVYAVLEAFGVTCPARQHAAKKILCAGKRGKGSVLDDLIGAAISIDRAIQMEQARQVVKDSLTVGYGPYNRPIPCSSIPSQIIDKTTAATDQNGFA